MHVLFERKNTKVNHSKMTFFPIAIDKSIQFLVLLYLISLEFLDNEKRYTDKNNQQINKH